VLDLFSRVLDLIYRALDLVYHDLLSVCRTLARDTKSSSRNIEYTIVCPKLAIVEKGSPENNKYQSVDVIGQTNYM